MSMFRSAGTSDDAINAAAQKIAQQAIGQPADVQHEARWQILGLLTGAITVKRIVRLKTMSDPTTVADVEDKLFDLLHQRVVGPGSEERILDLERIADGTPVAGWAGNLVSGSIWYLLQQVRREQVREQPTDRLFENNRRDPVSPYTYGRRIMLITAETEEAIEENREQARELTDMLHGARHHERIQKTAAAFRRMYPQLPATNKIGVDDKVALARLVRNRPSLPHTLALAAVDGENMPDSPAFAPFAGWPTESLEILAANAPVWTAALAANAALPVRGPTKVVERHATRSVRNLSKDRRWKHTADKLVPAWCASQSEVIVTFPHVDRPMVKTSAQVADQHAQVTGLAGEAADHRERPAGRTVEQVLATVAGHIESAKDR